MLELGAELKRADDDRRHDGQDFGSTNIVLQSLRSCVCAPGCIFLAERVLKVKVVQSQPTPSYIKLVHDKQMSFLRSAEASLI